jgi:phage shock protein A
MARGAFSRITDVVRAEVDDILTRLEDPKKMVRQMLMDMEAGLDDAIAAVAHSMANEKMVERQLKARMEDSELWQKKAEAALVAGEEELARRALAQKVIAAEVIAALEQGLVEASEATKILRKRLADMKRKLASARSRQGALVMLQNTARSHRDIGHSGDSSAFARYDQFCEDVKTEEVIADVYAEVSGVADPELDRAFESLEQKKKVDAEIEKLKSRTQKTS